MPEPSLVTRKRRLWTVGLLLFAMACADGGGDGCSGGCGDGGCGLGASVPYPATAPVIDQSAQVRVSRHGLEFIEDNAGALVGEFLEDGLAFCVPAGEVIGVTYCADETVAGCGEAGCLFSGEIDRVTLTPRSGESELKVVVLLGDIAMAFPLDSDVTGYCGNLEIQSNPTLPVEVTVRFRLDDDGRTFIELTDITLNLDRLEAVNTVPSSSVCDGVLDDDPDCEEARACDTYAGIIGVALDVGPLLEVFFRGEIESALEEQLCLPCDAGCPTGAYCGEDPVVCRWDDDDACVPLPLGTEGFVDLPALMADFNPALENGLSYLVYLANYADTELGGISLGVQGGMFAEYDDCVPRQDPPNLDTVPKSTELLTDQTPGGSAFMVGVGVSDQFINLALWAVYQSGAMCISVGSDTVPQLSSASLSLIIGSLAELTEDQNVPMLIRLRPTEAPEIKLGTGEVLPGDPPTILDPLLTVVIRDLFIDFYAYVEERYVRIFTLDTDVEVPLALIPTDDGSGIQVLLGDLEEAFTRVEPMDAELLAEEDVEMLAELLPTLVGAFAPTLTDALDQAFEIPPFAGYRLVIDENSFTSIEGATMLAIFANLEPDESGGGEGAFTFVPRAVARLVRVEGPTPTDIARFEAARDRGQVIDIETLRTQAVLAVDTPDAPDDADRQYTYRIDGGLWHLYRPGPTLTVADPAFFVEGPHQIEVRSRIPGQPESGSLVSEPVELMIDLARPHLALHRASDDVVEVEAYDSAWPDSALTMRYRFEGGAWSPPSPVVAISLPEASEAGGRARLEVEVSDPAGHSRRVSRTFALHQGPAQHSASEGDSGGCGAGCRVVGPSAGGSQGLWLTLAGLLGLWVVGRRRPGSSGRRGWRALARVLPWLSLLALLGFVAGCGDDEPPTTSQDAGREPFQPTGCEEEGCSGDQLCIDNTCVDNTCAADEECPEGMVCSDDRCVQRLSCDGDSECPDGQFCIDDDDDGGSECLAVPCEGDGDCGFINCGGGRIPLCIDSSCACEIPCAEGCGEDQFCCNPTNSCEPLPQVCEPLECDVGYGPAVVTEATGDPNSCEVSGPDCECRELPPLPLGDVGSYLSAAEHAGTIYLAAFNRTYGDLMVGTVGDNGTVDWEFVDGLPEEGGTVTGSLNGPRGGVADPGPRVGRYTSLAAGDDGTLHLAYYHRTNRTLQYARGVPSGDGFDWSLSEVDDTRFSGLYASLTLSSTGVPGIAYLVERAESAPGVWQTQLRYAWADAANPTSWTIEVADSAQIDQPCGGPCLGSDRCHAEVNRCERPISATNCGGCPSGQLCFTSAEDTFQCGTEIELPRGLVFLSEGLGVFADSARFSNDDVAVVYYDHPRGDLRYVASTGGTFAGALAQILDGQADGEDTGDVGWYPAILVDDDQVHVTYVDTVENDLRYIALGSDRIEVIDQGLHTTGGDYETVLVGDDSSLVVRPDGVLQVAYMDSSNHDVLVARRLEVGWSGPTVMMGDESPYQGAFGFYLDQLVVDGTIYLISYRIDSRAGVRDVVVHEME